MACISARISNFIKNLDKPFDFQGQDLSQRHLYIIFTFGYLIATILGWCLKDFKYLLFTSIFTVVVAFFAVVPSWPWYRKSNKRFVPVPEDEKEKEELKEKESLGKDKEKDSGDDEEEEGSAKSKKKKGKSRSSKKDD